MGGSFVDCSWPVGAAEQPGRETAAVLPHTGALTRTERAGDGPETAVDPNLFPPPYWPDKMDETPAKATASAKHGK